MATYSGEGDVPVTCTRSGLIMVLHSIFWDAPDRQTLVAAAIRNLNEMGVEARIMGRACPGCREGSSHPFIGQPEGLASGPCEYRPLWGPLFVPRPS